MFHRSHGCRPAHIPVKIFVRRRRRRRPATAYEFRPQSRPAAAARLQEDGLTLQTFLQRRQWAGRAGHRDAG